MSLRVEAGFHHLKDAFAQILAEVVEFEPGMLVTVLGAKVTANTSHAKVILSVFPENKEKEALAALHDFRREIKESLAEKLRLRRIPNLHYSFDRTGAMVAEVDRLINQIES